MTKIELRHKKNLSDFVLKLNDTKIDIVSYKIEGSVNDALRLTFQVVADSESIVEIEDLKE